MDRLILAVLIAFVPVLALAAETEDTEKPASLNVKTVPDNAEIAVNSEAVGVAPVRGLVLTPDEYAVTVFFAGSEPVEKNIVLEAGTTTDVRFYLNKGDGNDEGWFSGRDWLFGFALFWGVLGLSLVIINWDKGWGFG